MEAVNQATRCPICDTEGTPSFSAKGYEFSKCGSAECSHVFVDPMPTLDELDVYYAKNTSGLENSDSWTMVEDYAKDPSLVRRFYEGNRIKFLRRRGYLKQTTSVLDVGCSTGMFLRVLKDSGQKELMGVDVSMEQVRHCREVNEIEAYRQLSQIPRDRAFDLVTLYAVLEHVPNPAEVLRESVERMNKDGRLIVDVPNYRSLYRYLSRKRWLWLIPPVHLQYFTPKSMVNLANRCGLEVDFASTKSTSTYTYILVYHIYDLLGKEMPTTSLSASSFRTFVVKLIEMSLRLLLTPISLLMRATFTHNQIIYVFKRK